MTVFCIFSPGTVWASLSGDLVCRTIQPARLHNLCLLRGVSVNVDINTKLITVCIRCLVNNADTTLGVGGLHSPPFMLRSSPPPDSDAIRKSLQVWCDWTNSEVMLANDWLSSQRLPRNPFVNRVLLCGAQSPYHQGVWRDRLSNRWPYLDLHTFNYTNLHFANAVFFLPLITAAGFKHTEWFVWHYHLVSCVLVNKHVSWQLHSRVNVDFNDVQNTKCLIIKTFNRKTCDNIS